MKPHRPDCECWDCCTKERPVKRSAEEWLEQMKQDVDAAPNHKAQDVKDCCLCGSRESLRKLWFANRWICSKSHITELTNA